MAETPKHYEPVHMFFHLVESFTLGIERLQAARIVTLHARLAVLLYRSKPPQDITENPYRDVLAQVHDVARGEYEAFEYITNVSHLVYATTLLDALLTDCTKFLLLLHPGAIGKAQSVTLDTILNATSRADVLTQAATKKVRELSYLPFIARVDFLRQTFGLKIELDEETAKELEHYAGVRNVAVHDQSVWDPFLTDDRGVDVRQKTCPVHPTRVADSDLKRALRSYAAVAHRVADGVVNQILKAGDATEAKSLDKALAKIAGVQRDGPDLPADT